MDYYRLEYCENQGLFHFADIDIITDPPCSWVVICNKISFNQCMAFTEFIDLKYPIRYVNCFTPLKIVQLEFINFLNS